LPLFFNNYGLVYYKKGQYDRAIEDYNRTIALDPNCAPAYYNRGLAYALSENMGKAISDFQKACDIGDENGCDILQ
jgi:tetratricopeptide (TPR) repeat protein